MFKERQVIVNDLAIKYLDEGTGQSLLLVHGWRDKKETFDSLTKHLSKNYRCICVDLPNFGASQDSENTVTIEQYAKFLQAFISKLELNDYIVLGHSMGGQIAIYGTGTKIVSPNALVLVASAGVRSNARIAKQVLKFTSKIIRNFVPNKLKNKLYKKVGSDYSTQLSPVHKKIIANVLQHDVQQIASQITVPALLVYGQKDVHTPISMGQALHRSMPTSKLVVLPDQDHWLHQSAASDIAVKIRKFLK